MKAYEPSQIRNIAVVGHGGSGKTMLVEALLYASGGSTRLGKIEEGTTHTDYEPEEHHRQTSISLGLAPIEWDGYKLNLIDCPGYADFHGDVACALRVADACLFVVSAVDGVQVQTELIWDEAVSLGIPCLFVVNKLDRERASFEDALGQLTEKFGSKPFPLQLPIGSEAEFKGVIDLLSNEAHLYDHESAKASISGVPSELVERVKASHTALVEAAAEGDDTLLEKYFDSGDLDSKETAEGLAVAVASCSAAPVLAASATHLVGIDLLADTLCALVPSPLSRPAVVGISAGNEAERAPDPSQPSAAFIFKTISDPYVGKISLFKVLSGDVRPDHALRNATQNLDEKVHQLFYMVGKEHVGAPRVVTGDIGAVAKLVSTHTGDTLCDSPAIVLPRVSFPVPVLSIAVTPKSLGEEEKLSNALHRLIEEDPVLRMERNAETHQTVVSGLGENHLSVVVEKLKRKFGIEVEQLPLRIAYRETIKTKADYESRYIKQSGGRGQYAVAHLEVAPRPHGAGYEFVNKIVGGAIPGNFIPSVDKGVQGAMNDGVLAGYPVVDISVTVFDGKFHSVDSSDMAFQLAGSMGFKEACRKAGVSLLEPIVDAIIRVPDAMLGDIMGDINSKRGKIMGTEPLGRGVQEVHAQAPASEMARFAIDLRSITGGRGSFTMEFSHYEQVPAHLQDKLVETAKSYKQGSGKH